MHGSWPKPTAAEVTAFRAAAPPAVPDRYLEYIAEFGAVQLDVKVMGSGFVWFWPLSEVLKLNEGYRISKFAEGLFGFGSDGAGELYVFDLRDPVRVTVGQVPAIPLEIAQYQVLAGSFEEFGAVLSTGTPAPRPDAG